MPTTTAPAKTKISVSLSEEAAKVVEDLSAKHGLTASEVVRRALSSQRFIEEVLEEGSTLLVRHANDDLERVQFVFS